MLAHLLGVAAGGLGGFHCLEIDGQERSAKALDLLLRRGAHIGR
jgi:hypothetical protein